MKKFYRHLGYYNMTEDIKFLGKKRADIVVNYLRHRQGHFYSVDSDEEFPVDDLLESDKIDFSYDGFYAVENDALGWDMFDAWCEGKTENEDSGLYIDIFYLYRIEVNGHSYVLSEEP